MTIIGVIAKEAGGMMNVSTKVITAKIMGKEGNHTKMTTCVALKMVMKAIRNRRMNDEDRREKYVAMDSSSSKLTKYPIETIIALAKIL